MRFKRILVTGGAGFIGSAFIRYGLAHFPELETVVNFDLLTYAGDEKKLASVAHDPRYIFVRGDIRFEAIVQTLCEQHQIEAIVHFAAESHVDRSIAGPKAFLETNVMGTFALLEVVRRLPHIHFHHVSTDEVYGSLDAGFFHEQAPYRPNSPYAASKAASDHLVRAWAHTYNLSTTLSHCSNNYGPYQHLEKLIPQTITKCQQRQPIPIYGTGENVRDWLYVYDHAEAVWMILNQGKIGEVYDIGGACEQRNLDVVKEIISLVGRKNDTPLDHLITFVPDRPGHDFRYAIDFSKIRSQLGWTPRHTLAEGLEKTVEWYIS